jgi:phage FluMu protein Com
MGSYYYLHNETCPYCKKVLDEVVFFTSACDEEGMETGYDTGRCEHCGKIFRIYMDFTLERIDD